MPKRISFESTSFLVEKKLQRYIRQLTQKNTREKKEGDLPFLISCDSDALRLLLSPYFVLLGV